MPVGCFMILAVLGDVFSSVITRWVNNWPNDWMIVESFILRRSALPVKALSLSLWICHIFSLLSRLVIVIDIEEICQLVNYGIY